MATYYVTSGAGGGGVGSEGDPWTLQEAMANLTAGDVCFALAGTYTIAAALAPSASGDTASGAISIEGYTTTIGDGWRSDAPVCFVDSGGVVAFQSLSHIAKSFWVWKYFKFQNSSNSPMINLDGNSHAVVMYRCDVTNSGVGNGHSVWAQGRGIQLIGCGIEQWGSSRIGIFCSTGHGLVIDGCRINGAGVGSLGIQLGEKLGMTVRNTVIEGCASHGVTLDSSLDGYRVHFNGCIFHNNGGSGFAAVDAADNEPCTFVDCYFTDNAGYGLAQSGNANVHIINSYAYNNTSGNVQAGFNESNCGKGLTALTSSPYVDASNGDFRIKHSLSNIANRGDHWESDEMINHRTGRQAGLEMGVLA